MKQEPGRVQQPPTHLPPCSCQLHRASLTLSYDENKHQVGISPKISCRKLNTCPSDLPQPPASANPTLSHHARFTKTSSPQRHQHRHHGLPHQRGLPRLGSQVCHGSKHQAETRGRVDSYASRDTERHPFWRHSNRHRAHQRAEPQCKLCPLRLPGTPLCYDYISSSCTTHSLRVLMKNNYTLQSSV